MYVCMYVCNVCNEWDVINVFNLCMYVSMFVCMYVYMYAMYVCMFFM
jgi:hypothetical protein